MAPGQRLDRILAILSAQPFGQDRTALRQILDNSDSYLREVADCREAFAFFGSSSVHVIVGSCDSSSQRVPSNIMGINGTAWMGSS
jgi:hypothetical protein